MDHTTVGLLASIRRRASIPNTATTGTADSDLLAYANEELPWLAGEILSVREEYFVRDYDHTLTSATAYKIPRRAIGQKLRDVSLVGSDGSVFRIPRTEPERLDAVMSSDGEASGYLLKNDDVVLVPTASSSFPTLRLSYFQRPNELVASGFQTITGVSQGASTYTLAMASSSGFTTSTPCDLVSAQPGFPCHAIDITPSSIPDGTHVTFSGTAPTALATSDYLCLARESPVPQVPMEFHAILAQAVANRVMLAMGDGEGASRGAQTLAQMKALALDMISPRSDGAEQKVANLKGHLGVL
jgi:hypothetical protein